MSMSSKLRIVIPLAMLGSLITVMVFAGQASAVHPSLTGGNTFHYPVVPAFDECTQAEAAASGTLHGGTLPVKQGCHNPTSLSVSATPGTSTAVGTRVGFGDIGVCNATTGSGLCNAAVIGTAPDVRLRGNGSDIVCKIGTGAGGPCPGGVGSDYNPIATPGPYTGNIQPFADSNSQTPTPICKPNPPNPASCQAGADMTAEANIPDNEGAAGDVIRVTDHFNTVPSTGDPAGCGGSQSCTATVVDNPFPVPIVCESNSNATIGSYCGVNVTANSTLPGVVVAGKKAVVEIGQLNIHDIGTDLNRGDANDGIAGIQGIYIP